MKYHLTISPLLTIYPYPYPYLLLLIILIIQRLYAQHNELSSSSIPVIDISPLLKRSSLDLRAASESERLEYQSLIHELRKACTEWGLFHVINHGIEDSVQQDLRIEAKRFFDSPLNVKKRFKRLPNNSRGYANDELTKRKLDVKEIFDIGPSEIYLNVSEKALQDQQTDGITPWPDNDELSGLRPAAERFYEKSRLLAERIMSAVLESMACTSDLDGQAAYVKEQFSQHTSFLRMNFYPATSNLSVHHTCEVELESSAECRPEPSPDNVTLGISRHTDSGTLTILMQDEKHSALEVYSGSKEDNNDGKWIPVDPLDGALTVNTGDMLQVWSNNLFKAAEHRVRASQSKDTERYSVAFFFNPSYDTVVEPLCQENVSLYSPIRWGDFRTLRFLGDYSDRGEEIQIEHYRKVVLND